MTEEKLQAIKKQLSALVPATWTPVAIWSDDGTTISAVGPQRTNEDDAVRDAYFIAYAPANVAALLAHVDELQAKLDAVTDERDELRTQVTVFEFDNGELGRAQRRISRLQAKIAEVTP